MADRIKRQPDKLRDQLIQASAAATAAGAAWRAGAPTPAQLTAGAAAIDTRITSTKNLAASLRIEESAKGTATTAGIALMKEVDEETDALYGADGPQKLNFGLSPKGGAGGGPPPLHKLIEIRTLDGAAPGSFLFDWETIQGASYEVKWFSNGTLTQLVGSATATRSDYLITGLTAGQQYWMIVRPVRGSEQGPWSDPATRVANV